MSLEDLARRCDLVSQQYARRHGIDRDEAWRLMKLQEEVGELVRAVLRRREGRPIGPDSVADELADVVAQALVVAHHEGVDLQAALDRTWLGRLTTAEWPEVVGVDACPAGWFGVLLGRGPARSLVAPTLAELLEMVGEVGAVAVDIPIGLPDSVERTAEAQVRSRLGPRSSSVFNTLVRDAYESATYEEAVEVHRRATGKGFSKQSWGLRAKILEVDAFVRTYSQATVVEVHPELSFTHLAGAPMTHGKKTPEGQAERREALRSVGIVPPHRPPRGVGEDDLLDACAAAWSAARVVRGEAVPHPEVPETFSDGWPSAIWA